MARPMSETTKTILSVLASNPEITYNEAVDQGLIDPATINTPRFNVTKSNFKKGKIGGQAAGATRQRRTRKVPTVPKATGNGRRKVGRQTYTQYKGGAAIRTLVNVPDMGDLTAAMKIITDAGGLAKAKATIATATTLQGAVQAIENARAALGKIA